MLLDMLDGWTTSFTRSCSDFVTLIELLWWIRTHMPLYASRSDKDCVQTEHGLYWKLVMTNHHQRKRPDSSGARAALGKFQNSSPPSGPRNCQWLDQFEALHGTSQDYWRAKSGLYRQAYRDPRLPVNFELHMRFLLAWSDPQYIAHVEAKRNQILSDMKKPKVTGSEDVFLPLPSQRMKSQT